MARLNHAQTLFVAIVLFSIGNFVFLFRSLEKHEQNYKSMQTSTSDSIFIRKKSVSAHSPQNHTMNSAVAVAVDNHFDINIYEKQRKEALKPFSNVTTVGTSKMEEHRRQAND
jgi:hypothetical protein